MLLMFSVAFTIAAIVTAAFGGPEWAWLMLAGFAVGFFLAELSDQ